MRIEVVMAITKMFNVFPQSQNTDIDGLLNTFVDDLAEISDQAIIDASEAFRKGDVSGQNLDFAPSMPRFMIEARKRDWELRPKPIAIAAPVEREFSNEWREVMVKRLKASQSFMCDPHSPERDAAFEKVKQDYPLPAKMYVDEAIN